MSDQKTILWKAPEYKHYEKTAGWYVTLISIAVLISSFFVIVQKDLFAGICFGIITCLIIFFSTIKPQEIEIELGEKSVKLGNLHFPYKQIKHFWIVDNEKHKTLNLHINTYINNILILELGGQDSDKIRNFLLDYIPEHTDTNETFAQKIIHFFKF